MNKPLPQFIRQNLESITEEWCLFAKTLAVANTSDIVLRDHIHQILFFIADDIELTQTAKQQHIKSQGGSDKNKKSPGAIHAELRHDIGFNLVEMAAEYRALRACVIKLWTQTRLVLTNSDVADLIRFNEAIDQLLAHSILAFINKGEIQQYSDKAWILA